MVTSKLDLTLFSTVVHASPKLVGKWKNELKSTMTIKTLSGDGTFNGVYESAVSASHKKVKGSLIGSVAGDSISFVVNWEPTFASVTAWSGKLMVDKKRVAHIYTLWLLSHGVDDPKDAWQSIVAGSDTFRKVA